MENFDFFIKAQNKFSEQMREGIKAEDKIKQLENVSGLSIDTIIDMFSIGYKFQISESGNKIILQKALTKFDSIDEKQKNEDIIKNAITLLRSKDDFLKNYSDKEIQVFLYILDKYAVKREEGSE